jgi:hypothetical protein
MFRYLIDKLAAYPSVGGASLLESGVAVWYNDHGDGPAHGFTNIPYVLAGSAGGFFKQNLYISARGGANHNAMLNTIASSAGVRNARGEYLDDFGDPDYTKGVMSELMATKSG